MNNLSLDLKAEKSSRSDLEMYVEVLSTQKNVLQTENDKIQKELVESWCLLVFTDFFALLLVIHFGYWVRSRGT